MVETKVARRREAPSSGENKSKGNTTVVKGKVKATSIAAGVAARSEKKEAEKKRKKKKKKSKVREASDQEATEGGAAGLERQEGAEKAVEANTAGKRERNKDKDKVVVC